MEASQRTVTFATVQVAELEEIRTRRKRAELVKPTSGEDAAEGNGQPLANSDLVGLALSGGGIRSAALSLGLLQSLYRGRVLKQVDYLSTVSGGGYAGGYLSAMLEEFAPQQKIDWEPSPAASRMDACDETLPPKRPLIFHAAESGEQPRDVRRLIHSGIYLRRIAEFIDTSLLGIVLNWVMILCGLMCGVTCIALLYRSLDYPTVQHVIAALGFRGDALRAFFPSFCLFIIWLLAHLSFRLLFRSRHGARNFVTSVLAVSLVSSLLLGMMTILNTGDVDFSNLRVDYGYQPSIPSVQNAQSWLWGVLFILIGLGLFPFLRRKDLMRSGFQPSSPHWQMWIAKAASWSLLAGLPLLLFGFIVRENLFGVNQLREERDYLSRAHIQDWADFWRRVKGMAGSERDSSAFFFRKTVGPSQFLLDRTEPRNAADKAGPAETPQLDESLLKESVLQDLDRKTWFFERWLSGISFPFAFPVQGYDNTWWKLYDLRRDSAELKDRLVHRLNTQVLDDPTFHRAFLNVKAGTVSHLLGADSGERKRFDRALEKAQALKGPLEKAIQDAEETRLVVPPASEAESGWNVRVAKWSEDLKARRHGIAQRTEDHRAEDTIQLQKEANELQDRIAKVQTIGLQVREANRELFQTYFGSDVIRSRDTSFALVVLGPDQNNRYIILVISLGLFVVLGFLVDINSTSVHRYYRDRLAEFWIYRQSRQGSEIPLSKLHNTEHGGPYHLINATVNLIGRNRELDQEATDCYLFSKRFCGSRQVGFASTDGDAKSIPALADAMAISGGAVSPLAIGNNPLLFYAMILINARLGQWVRRPGSSGRLQRPFIPAVWSYLTSRPTEAKYLYVSDGGHHDNTGIEALLHRRCKVIIACDASHDPNWQFLDFLRLVRRLRVNQGIRVQSLDGEPVSAAYLEQLAMKNPAAPEAAQQSTRSALGEQRSRESAAANFLVFRIVYPIRPDTLGTEMIGHLIYVKSTLTADTPGELVLYRHENHHFPHDSTVDQFFEPRRFECYRYLGFCLGDSVCSYFNRHSQKRDGLWLSQFPFAVAADEASQARAKSTFGAPAPTEVSAAKDSAKKSSAK